MTVINEDVKILIELSVKVEALAKSVEAVKERLSNEPRNIGDRLDSIHEEFIDIRNKIDMSIKDLTEKQGLHNNKMQHITQRLNLELISNHRLMFFGFMTAYVLLVAWILLSVTIDFKSGTIQDKLDRITETKINKITGGG